MQSLKSADLIGHINFLSWWQLNGCSVTRPFSLCEGCGLRDYNYNMIEQGVDLSLDYLWLKGKKPGFLVGNGDGWWHRYLQYWRLVSHGFNMILTSSLTYYIWQLWSRKEWHKRGRRALWRVLFESSLVLLFRLGRGQCRLLSYRIIMSCNYSTSSRIICITHLYHPTLVGRVPRLNWLLQLIEISADFEAGGKWSLNLCLISVLILSL